MPQTKLLSALGIGALVLVWLALLATNETAKAVEAVRGLLPHWFPGVNLFLAPLLAALATTSSPIPALCRFSAIFLMLCSFSALYLSYTVHPAGYILTLVIIIIELYWIIPKWNARRRAHLGHAERQ